MNAGVQYVCGECGHVTMTRTGRCLSCGAWGLLAPELPSPRTGGGAPSAKNVVFGFAVLLFFFAVLARVAGTEALPKALSSLSAFLGL